MGWKKKAIIRQFRVFLVGLLLLFDPKFIALLSEYQLLENIIQNFSKIIVKSFGIFQFIIYFCKQILTHNDTTKNRNQTRTD